MSQKFTFLSLAFIALFTIPASSQNNSLSFDGTSGYAAVSQDLIPTGTGAPFTVEAWVLVPSITSGKHYFVSQGNTHKLTLGYDGDNGGKITVGTDWTLSNAVLPAGTWTHVALTVGSDNSARLYINGAPSDSLLTSFQVDATPGQLLIGAGAGPANFMSGQLDQLMVWNIQLTGPQVKSSLYSSLAPTTTGLVAQYMMDESSGNAVNGTNPGPTDAVLQSTATRAASPVQFGNNAIDITGAHAKIVVPNNGIFDLNSGTIELLVNPDVFIGGITVGDLIGVRGAGGSRFNFNITNNGTVGTGVQLYNGTSQSNVSYTFNTGTWYHLAFVNNGTSTTVYVNGVAQPGTLDAFGTTTLQNLVIGLSDNGGSDGEPWFGLIDEVRIWSTQRTATEIGNNMGTTLTGNENGLIALYSLDQGIANGNNSGLTTIIDNSPNNLHGTAVNFQLTNTASFESGNFVPSSITTLPVNFSNFTAVARGKGVLLQWTTAQEQNSSYFTIQHSTDGKTYSDIGTVAAAGNSTAAHNYNFTDGAPSNGNNFYRLKEVDLDNKFMYSQVRTVLFGATSNKLTWYATGAGSANVVLDNGNNEWYIVSNAGGQIIKKGQLIAGKLELSGLPTGMYIINILAAQQTIAAKVEIQ